MSAKKNRQGQSKSKQWQRKLNRIEPLERRELMAADLGFSIPGDLQMNTTDDRIVAMTASQFGDFDKDHQINGADFLAWQRTADSGNHEVASSDANLDGAVDGQDLAIWRSNFGQTVESAISHLIRFDAIDGKLAVQGTVGDDDLHVERQGENLVVRISSEGFEYSETFSVDAVSEITLDSQGGEDSLHFALPSNSLPSHTFNEGKIHFSQLLSTGQQGQSDETNVEYLANFHATDGTWTDQYSVTSSDDLGNTIRQTFQADQIVSEESSNATGGVYTTSWNTDGTKTREAYQNGDLIMREEFDASGGMVRTTWNAEGTSAILTYQDDVLTAEEVLTGGGIWIHKTYQDGEQVFEESVDESTGETRRTTWEADGTVLRESFLHDELMLFETWDTTGGYIRTGWRDGVKSRQTFQDDVQISEENWDNLGGYQRTEWLVNGETVRDTFEDDVQVSSEVWTDDDTYVRTAWTESGTARQTFVDGIQTLEEIWDNESRYRRTNWLADGITIRDTFSEGVHILNEEWDGNGGYVRTGWGDEGTIRETFVEDLQTLEEVWTPDGDYRLTEWLADGTTTRGSYSNGEQVLQEEWDGNGGYIKTVWVDAGSLRQTFVDGNQTKEQAWDNSGGYQVTQWYADGSTVRSTFEDGTLVLEEAWDTNGDLTKTGWSDEGSIRQTFSDGRQIREEIWNNSGGFRRTDWYADGRTLRETYQDGSQVLSEEWDGSGGFVKVAWEGSRSMRETFSDGRQTRLELWSGSGGYRVTDWLSNSTVRSTYQDGTERVRETWTGNTLVRNNWDTSGNSMRETFVNGSEVKREYWNNSGGYRKIEWGSGSTVQSTYQGGTEILRETWTGNQHVRIAWRDGKSMRETFVNGSQTKEELWDGNKYKRTTWYSDGAVWVQYFLDGSERYRQTWDASGNYNEYSWDGGASSSVKNVVNQVKDAITGALGFGLVGSSGFRTDFSGTTGLALTGNWDTLVDWGTERANAVGFDDLGDWGTERWESLEGGFSDLGDWGTGRWDALVSTFEDLGDWGTGRWDAISSSWDDFTDFFDGGWKDFNFEEWAQDRWDSLINGFEDIGDWGTERWDSLLNGLNDLGDWGTHAWNAIEIGWNDFWDGAEDFWEHITGWFQPAYEIYDDDGDGLLNGWEMYGIDFNDDGIIDLDLPALGADPNHKDLFVEIDSMLGRNPTFIGAMFDFDADGTIDISPASVIAAGLATNTSLDWVIEAFLNAPVDNPDGVDGINLHILIDEINIPLFALPNGLDAEDTNGNGVLDAGEDANGSGALDGYVDIKEDRFGTAAERADTNWANIRGAKEMAFRYALFADTYGTTTSGGLAYGPGSDLIVTLGGWTTVGGTPRQQAGTFMHEFGHNLGLDHGGGDGTNDKTNYFSVMNYLWQTPNTATAAGIGGSWVLDYSDHVADSLDESCLDETVGVGSRTTMIWDPAAGTSGQWISVTGPYDFDGDGTISNTCVSRDLNNDGTIGTLNGFNDWANLRMGISGHALLGGGHDHVHDHGSEEVLLASIQDQNIEEHSTELSEAFHPLELHATSRSVSGDLGSQDEQFAEEHFHEHFNEAEVNAVARSYRSAARNSWNNALATDESLASLFNADTELQEALFTGVDSVGEMSALDQAFTELG